MFVHLILRYDRVPSEKISRSKYNNGATYFERYITVQCVNDSMHKKLAYGVHFQLLIWICVDSIGIPSKSFM